MRKSANFPQLVTTMFHVLSSENKPIIFTQPLQWKIITQPRGKINLATSETKTTVPRNICIVNICPKITFRIRWMYVRLIWQICLRLFLVFLWISNYMDCWTNLLNQNNFTVVLFLFVNGFTLFYKPLLGTVLSVHTVYLLT